MRAHHSCDDGQLMNSGGCAAPERNLVKKDLARVREHPTKTTSTNTSPDKGPAAHRLPDPAERLCRYERVERTRPRETLADARRMLFDRYSVVDAAIKVVGGKTIRTVSQPSSAMN